MPKSNRKKNEPSNLDTSKSDDTQEIETPKQIRERAREKLRNYQMREEYILPSERLYVDRPFNAGGYAGLNFIANIIGAVSLAAIDTLIDLATLLDPQTFTEAERLPDAAE